MGNKFVQPLYVQPRESFQKCLISISGLLASVLLAICVLMLFFKKMQFFEMLNKIGNIT